MKNNLRKIQAYSSNSSTELDCKKEYWFHQWVNPTTALVEDENGNLIKASWDEFKFIVNEEPLAVSETKELPKYLQPSVLDEKIKSLLNDLDDYARNYDYYEYGLPIDTHHLQDMTNIVKKYIN
jgi:hypothetical protein